MQSTVPKKGSAKYNATEGKAVKAKKRSPEAQCPKGAVQITLTDGQWRAKCPRRAVQRKGHRGAMQSTAPQRGSAE